MHYGKKEDNAVSYRKKINEQIKMYWKQIKHSIGYRRLRYRAIPSFTRHNGTRIRRLKGGWRYPKSSQGNRSRISQPKIGYRKPKAERFCVRAYGMRIIPVTNTSQLRDVVNQRQLPTPSARVGARTRKVLLEYARGNKLPLILRA